jgi:uncharacterized protein YdhG (YjbR/CyaY superfamily)
LKTSSVKKPVTVDEYIASFPKEVQKLLQQVRSTIQKAAPLAEEVISYGMPGYKLNGMLVYFAGYQHHIGFYATPTGHKAFVKELAAYKQGKGSVQFPIDKPMPLALIKRIVQFRITDNEQKLLEKKKGKVSPAKTKATKQTDEIQVKQWMDQLDAKTKSFINLVRTIIKNASPNLKERIKWNAPSYYYKEDIVTFGPHRTGNIFLVFHHPSVVTIKSELLQGNYKNRRLMYFTNQAEVKKNKAEISSILHQIIRAIDKG